MKYVSYIVTHRNSARKGKNTDKPLLQFASTFRTKFRLSSTDIESFPAVRTFIKNQSLNNSSSHQHQSNNRNSISYHRHPASYFQTSPDKYHNYTTPDTCYQHTITLFIIHIISYNYSILYFYLFNDLTKVYDLHSNLIGNKQYVNRTFQLNYIITYINKSTHWC